jgi:hypothetical protein
MVNKKFDKPAKGKYWLIPDDIAKAMAEQWEDKES